MIIYLTKQISIILLSNNSLKNLYRIITIRSSLKFFYKNGDSRALHAS